MDSFFENRTAVLVSKHGKEQVIGPLLKQAFNITLNIAGSVDTDLLGTFSGEVDRVHNQYDTAKLKIDLAKEELPYADLLLASEGAFNPHPDAPVITVNTELLLLRDLKNNFEIAAWYKTYNTNIERRKITSKAQLLDFATAIDFPNNRLILKTTTGANTLHVEKGAATVDELVVMFEKISTIADNNVIDAETDMRACYNTLRMESIRLCAINLVNAMQSTCGQCGTPGFSVAESKSGLPCRDCGMPTGSVLYYEYRCNKCNYTYDKKFPLGKENEDPMYCDFCNP